MLVGGPTRLSSVILRSCLLLFPQVNELKRTMKNLQSELQEAEERKAAAITQEQKAMQDSLQQVDFQLCQATCSQSIIKGKLPWMLLASDPLCFTSSYT